MNSSDNFPLPGGKIFLIGFMGSGKTHWGKIWAKQHSLGFFDLDERIEKAEKKTIAQIFEKDGEEHFREKERKALREFEKIENGIIACGGGTPCFYDNMKWMNENGITIYLASTAEDIFERVVPEQEQRPLIKKLDRPELLSFIERTLKEREPFYKLAKYILSAKNLNNKSVEKFITHNS